MKWDRFRKLFKIFWIVGMVLSFISLTRVHLGEEWTNWDYNIIVIIMYQLLLSIGYVGLSAAVLAAVFSMRKIGDRRDALADQPD